MGRRGKREEEPWCVYVEAQLCLILHKAFVHSVSKLCVSWVRRGCAHVDVCTCESVTEMVQMNFFSLQKPMKMM